MCLLSATVLVVQFSQSVTEALEGQRSVNITVEITAGEAERTVEVIFSALNNSGSATGEHLQPDPADPGSIYSSFLLSIL